MDPRTGHRPPDDLAKVSDSHLHSWMNVPPIASIITGARLLLALLEYKVTAKGGTWATADTDSLHVVADVSGHPVECPTADGTNTVLALRYADVDDIRYELNALNPFDRDAVPDLLKREVPTGTQTTLIHAGQSQALCALSEGWRAAGGGGAGRQGSSQATWLAMRVLCPVLAARRARGAVTRLDRCGSRHQPNWPRSGRDRP